ncbi:hypothetical protein [Phytohabitans rumicis]|uniref:AbiEi antitoxin C-terminal domain-containing protein n=1 Tax=Phytohabitans rumicis TaxID=1076125 RepID=A0A6V8KVP0_9ACTN|nr:hypothetical protein [Phytohabitans rumicis]GFJ86471.1 hypothetical protein Prum_001130 [Phytohabitans rumicis]
MLEELCERQCGVVTRAQALRGGMTLSELRARLRSGRWQRVFDGVFAAFSGPLPRMARLWAVLLRAGPGAVLSHHTAAELAGLVPAQDPVHVTLPPSRRVARIPGVVVHVSRAAGAGRHPTRVPAQTRVEETVVDLTQSARDLDEAIGWLARACGQRLTTAARLSEAFGARFRVRWRTELTAALRDVADGCHSVLEMRYLRRVERAHGLPRSTRQRARRRPGGRWYDDVYYAEYQVVVEVDGRAAHPDERRWRDMERDNAGVAAGRASCATAQRM